MKTIKNIFAVLLILLSSALIPIYSNTSYFKLFLFLIVIFLIFNLTIRKSLSFKHYFTSKYNLLTTKIRRKKSFDIPKDLLFNKIIEVIKDLNLKLVKTDIDTYQILAISPLTFLSWGENIYFDFETNENETIMNFCSTTFFQMFDWGKNEKNYEDLLNQIERSLII